MKKIHILIIMILFFPIFVKAEDNNLLLKSITLEKLSKDVEELSPATIENNKINLDLKMYEVGDTAEYRIIIKNPSNEDLYIEKNLVVTKSNYFDYELLASDKTTIIEKNSEKEFILKVKYQNEVPEENFFSAKYKDISNLAFQFKNELNPETKRNIVLFLIVFLLIFVSFKYNKKSTVFLLLFSLGFIPFITQAANNYDIEINSNILIKKVKPNTCTFDGELVQGAEYTNGQYTYRYMQESQGTWWKKITNEGWGVMLTDKNSEEDVTTKLCTSINDKPIISMSYMFDGSKAKNVDLSSFDTSNVTSMYSMFYGMMLPTELNLSSFDTSNVTNMSAMFANNENLKSIDLHYFDTSNVTSMAAMFYGDATLEEVKLDGFDLTASTEGSAIIRGMFNNTNSIKKISIKNWKIPKSFTDALGCRNLQLCSQNLEYIDVTGWDLKQTENVNGVFGDYKAKKIIGLNTWDTSNITSMVGMFHGASGLESIDLSSFDTSNVTNMSGMFYGTSGLKTIDLSNFDTSNVTSMGGMFHGASELKTIDLSNFDTSNVISMGEMFANDISLEEVNLDGFDLTASTNGSSVIASMFVGDNNLKIVSMKNWKIPKIFVHALGCRTLQLCSQNLEYIDVTGWDLKQTENVFGLFGDYQAKEIRGLDTWNTSKVINMQQMFEKMTQLEKLDLSSFDTSNVTNMSLMFSDSSNLKTIIAGNKFKTEQVETSDYMFSKNLNLVGGEGTAYNENYQDKTYARIDTINTPGYFTSNS